MKWSQGLQPLNRSRFSVSIKSKYAEYFVLFNTKEVSRKVDSEDADYFITKFETTPKLPLYTLAFLVADFEIFEDLKSNMRLTGPNLSQNLADEIFELSQNISDGLRKCQNML